MPRKRKNTRLLQGYNDKRKRIVQEGHGKEEENTWEIFDEQILENSEFDSQEEENEVEEKTTRIRLLTTALI